ncbi:MAG: hypothetical protein U0X20_07245 [Caldilineaceae bacterium]
MSPNHNHLAAGELGAPGFGVSDCVGQPCLQVTHQGGRQASGQVVLGDDTPGIAQEQGQSVRWQ